ncbi:MAG TPA: short-chain dehydrogenase/reductase, partial [Burkholderiaceae bacterium]
PAPAAYEPLLQRVFAGFADSAAPVTRAQDVAEAVWRAATDAACPMFLPAGADAVAATEAAGQ